MDLHYGEEQERFREEVREFLHGWPLVGEDALLPPAEQEALFRARGIDAGYVYRDIPAQYGGGGQAPDVLKDAICRDEYARAGR